MNRGIASAARFRLSFIRFIATFYLEMQFQLEVYIQNYHRWVVKIVQIISSHSRFMMGFTPH